VGEIEEEGRKRLIGVGRLVCDANVEKGEYAVRLLWVTSGRGKDRAQSCLTMRLILSLKKGIEGDKRRSYAA